MAMFSRSDTPEDPPSPPRRPGPNLWLALARATMREYNGDRPQVRAALIEQCQAAIAGPVPPLLEDMFPYAARGAIELIEHEQSPPQEPKFDFHGMTEEEARAWMRGQSERGGERHRERWHRNPVKFDLREFPLPNGAMADRASLAQLEEALAIYGRNTTTGNAARERDGVATKKG